MLIRPAESGPRDITESFSEMAVRGKVRMPVEWNCPGPCWIGLDQETHSSTDMLLSSGRD